MDRIFCDASCRESYFTDRRYGLIYGSLDVEGYVTSWLNGCFLIGACPYCRAYSPRRGWVAARRAVRTAGAAHCGDVDRATLATLRFHADIVPQAWASLEG